MYHDYKKGRIKEKAQKDIPIFESSLVSGKAGGRAKRVLQQWRGSRVPGWAHKGFTGCREAHGGD